MSLETEEILVKHKDSFRNAATVALTKRMFFCSLGGFISNLALEDLLEDGGKCINSIRTATFIHSLLVNDIRSSVDIDSYISDSKNDRHFMQGLGWYVGDYIASGIIDSLQHEKWPAKSFFDGGFVRFDQKDFSNIMDLHDDEFGDEEDNVIKVNFANHDLTIDDDGCVKPEVIHSRSYKLIQRLTPPHRILIHKGTLNIVKGYQIIKDRRRFVFGKDKDFESVQLPESFMGNFQVLSNILGFKVEPLYEPRLSYAWGGDLGVDEIDESWLTLFQTDTYDNVRGNMG